MPADSNQAEASKRTLPRAKKLIDSGQPGGGQGRVDLTGTMPPDIKVDPYITEGHSGYQESGDSEIIPPKPEAGA
jgi:hypothetical protein